MKHYFIGLLCACFTGVAAQEYSALLLPDSLSENANAVNRYYELRINVISENKVMVNEKRAITVLNEGGDDFADYVSTYDRFNSINYLDGNLYDAFGKKIKEVKKKDIQDHPVQDGISLMLDDRYKQHNFYCKSYPYTVEYEEEDESRQTFYFPAFAPQISHLMSVQNSRLVITAPESFKIRFQELNLNAIPAVTKNKGQVIYTWVINGIKAKKPQPFSPSWQQLAPAIFIAPSSFAMENYHGNMDTWQNYGKFINNLRKGRDVLPEQVKVTVHQLTDNIKDEKEKINILYAYLQKNSRYISVQLGIGGLQPFDAAYVAGNKYGDCKALSNYMITLLQEAGIKADYVLIRAGSNANAMYTGFPMTQFNHATVCVPMAKDSVWLECTDQTGIPGFSGEFTGNRYALLVNETGGHVVKTPVYTEKDNYISRSLKGAIDENGNLTAEVVTSYKGCASQEVHDLLNYSLEDKEKKLKKEFDLPTYNVVSFKHTEERKAMPSIDEDLKIEADKYANISGKRLFILPPVLTRSNTVLDTAQQRLYNVLVKDAFTQSDSVRLIVPADYHAEALPKIVNLTTKFGEFKTSVIFENNEVIYTRYYIQRAGNYPPEDFKDFATFMNTVYKADRSKVVLTKNN